MVVLVAQIFVITEKLTPHIFLQLNDALTCLKNNDTTPESAEAGRIPRLRRR